MTEELSEGEFLRAYDPNQFARPCLAADAIVFHFADGQINILLIQRRNHPFRGHWVFPGGFVEVYEEPVEAARRELREETGLALDDLFELGAFGRPDRDPRYHVVSVAFIGIAAAGKQDLQPDDDAQNAAWYRVSKAPPLGFDHEDILDAALTRLRREMVRPSFALRFLGRSFTGADIIALYQQVFGRKLDAQRFLRRLSSVCTVKPTLTAPVRMSRQKMRRFEAHLGQWWLV
ncbi:NUDIX hydrolase [Candidatus Sumerlaeota bacterium]|nr:NUDIX hydrolase [Candidatus Sumerlaeota bacterium]